jgi:hypothetical protein
MVVFAVKSAREYARSTVYLVHSKLDANLLAVILWL